MTLNKKVHELPFVVHGLFMKKFMTSHRKVHEPAMVLELPYVVQIIHESVHELHVVQDIKLKFMNHLVHELPFFFHGLVMKMFMTYQKVIHEQQMAVHELEDS